MINLFRQLQILEGYFAFIVCGEGYGYIPILMQMNIGVVILNLRQKGNGIDKLHGFGEVEKDKLSLQSMLVTVPVHFD